MSTSSKFLNLIDLSKPFAFFGKNGRVSCYQGALHQLEGLDDIDRVARETGRDVAFVLPYRIIRERGFEAVGDEPILGLETQVVVSVPAEQVLAELPSGPISVEGEISSTLSDDAYAAMVASFQANEIEKGNASQTTLSRCFMGQIEAFDISTALSLYRRVLQQQGAYMAVLFANVCAEDPGQSQFIVGATPERHLEISGNDVIMMPIAGTLRKEDRATFEARLDAFLNDPKEINELFQVVDEEMKMMGVICPEGGKIEGPLLHEIGAVVHTEYQLVGRRSNDTISALRRTLHAPTVVGSPMESAARIIKKYEGVSRRYYAGEIGIYRCPRSAAPNGDLDSAILIRCAEVDGAGRFRVQSGGGLVRDSDPMNEARESCAKAKGLLGLLTGAAQLSETYLTDDLRKKVEPLFTGRNKNLSSFWMDRQNPYGEKVPSLDGMKITILNNEDDFAYMIGHILRVMKAEVLVCDSLRYKFEEDDAALVVLGPGPGDPTDMTHPRMRTLQEIISRLSVLQRPLLGVCLGHQALAFNKGLSVERQRSSTQGMQREVTVRGERMKLGFYNSFSPVYDEKAEKCKDIAFDLDENRRIIALFGDRFIGFQFHPESIMSSQGAALLYSTLVRLKESA